MTEPPALTATTAGPTAAHALGAMPEIDWARTSSGLRLSAARPSSSCRTGEAMDGMTVASSRERKGQRPGEAGLRGGRQRHCHGKEMDKERAVYVIGAYRL